MQPKARREALANLRLVETDKGSWSFEYKRLTFEIIEEFDDAYDLARIGRVHEAERAISRLARTYPEFIDAHHHLALIYSKQGDDEAAFELWHSTVDLGLSVFPSTFCFGRDRIIWADLDNRPFLRAYHALGLVYFEQGLYGEALSCFKNLYDLNPNDNQGVRALLINGLFRLRRPLDVLRFCKRHRDLADEWITYGRVLAYFWLREREKAAKALVVARRYLPLIAEEIGKERHRKPPGLREGYVTMGGADQAYAYWEDFGESWKFVEGAVDFVRAQLG